MSDKVTAFPLSVENTDEITASQVLTALIGVVQSQLSKEEITTALSGVMGAGLTQEEISAGITYGKVVADTELTPTEVNTALTGIIKSGLTSDEIGGVLKYIAETFDYTGEGVSSDGTLVSFGDVLFQVGETLVSFNESEEEEV